jgi:hypothetical protein
MIKYSKGQIISISVSVNEIKDKSLLKNIFSE